jgi:hypothetical protein
MDCPCAADGMQATVGVRECAADGCAPPPPPEWLAYRPL